MLYCLKNNFYILIVIILLTISGCGPGAKDGFMHIAGGYYFTHHGGVENLINYKDEKKSEIVIDAKVDQFLLNKEHIFVSRQPVRYYKEDDILNQVVEQYCEYWIIYWPDQKIQGPLAKDKFRNTQEWIDLEKQIDTSLHENARCPLKF